MVLSRRKWYYNEIAKVGRFPQTNSKVSQLTIKDQSLTQTIIQGSLNLKC